MAVPIERRVYLCAANSIFLAVMPAAERSSNIGRRCSGRRKKFGTVRNAHNSIKGIQKICVYCSALKIRFNLAASSGLTLFLK